MDNVVGLDWDGISLETARKRQNKIEKKEQTSTLLYKTKNGFHLEIIFKVPLLVSENFKLREKYYDCSVSEDTTLYWKENGKLQFSKISQVYSSFKKGNKVNVIGIHLKKKDERLTKKNCEITWMPIKYVACHGKQKIYQITLNNGQKVEITHHHSLFGKYDGRQEITSLNLHEINPNIFKIAHITKEIKEKTMQE